jgi:4-hydroxy-tetrahydrodipicolinate reductase
MTAVPTQVAHIGLGAIGREVVRLVVQRADLQLVAACDIDPDLVGASLGVVLGEETANTVTVTERLTNVSPSSGSDLIVTHTTSSSLARCLPELLSAVAAGAHVVSSCEELSYPWLQAPEAAATLDHAARTAGVSVVGTGVNPGFAMDYLPVVLSGAARQVESVRVHRVQDAGQRREPLQAKVGAGISAAEFERRVAGRTIGHVGLTESAQAVAAALGWAVDWGLDWDLGSNLATTETIEPVLAETAVPSVFGVIEPGQVTGIDQVAVVTVDDVERVRLRLSMAVGIGPSRDDIWLTGDPDLHLSVPRGLHGDVATAAAVVNTIGSIRHAEPGLRVMSELRPPRPTPARTR